jgi:hypothetical protein
VNLLLASQLGAGSFFVILLIFIDFLARASFKTTIKASKQQYQSINQSINQ